MLHEADIFLADNTDFQGQLKQEEKIATGRPVQIWGEKLKYGKVLRALLLEESSDKLA